jgi:hypothetical protein
MTLTRIARRLNMGTAGSLVNQLRNENKKRKYAIVRDPFMKRVSGIAARLFHDRSAR